MVLEVKERPSVTSPVKRTSGTSDIGEVQDEILAARIRLNPSSGGFLHQGDWNALARDLYPDVNGKLNQHAQRLSSSADRLKVWIGDLERGGLKEPPPRL